MILRNSLVRGFGVLALLFTVACAGGPGQSSTGEYIDDSVITGRVKTAIIKDDSLNAAEVNVETFKGEVQLSGFIGSKEEMDRAVELARSVKGVESVKNDMRLKQR